MSPAIPHPATEATPEAIAEAVAESCARRILETVPLVMRVIRREMRGATDASLSVPQFRVLAYLGRNGGASLSVLAEHLGVADATASTMVDRLVKRELVSRAPHPEERRRIVLDLTEQGQALLGTAKARARSYLAKGLAGLDAPALARVEEGLELLARALELQP